MQQALSPKQQLVREAYFSEQWFLEERERLFSRCWSFAGVAHEFEKAGDYLTVNAHGYPIFVVKDGDGEFRAFHNLCRHRGTELVDGSGNCGRTVVCPYHRWTYGLDGTLRGVPDIGECFPGLDRSQFGLKQAAIGIFNGLIFVNPSPDPELNFDSWLRSLRDAAWPHDLAELTAGDEFVYRIKCNWKILFENAVDGYHLAYLHENTLGGPVPGKNEWEIHDLNMVWYSTERDGVRHRVPEFVEKNTSTLTTPTIPAARQPGYGGVYMLFPTTIVTPSAWSMTISKLEPVSPTETLLRARTWMPGMSAMFEAGPEHAPGYDKNSGEIRSEFWTEDPLSTGDFQTEDIWICEKMQRSLGSPAYGVGAMAKGSGGEMAVEIFQKSILEFMK